MARPAERMMDEHAQMIADCEARDSRLSDWERSFIDSIGAQIAAGRGLSSKQADILDRIWESATSKG